ARTTSLRSIWRHRPSSTPTAHVPAQVEPSLPTLSHEQSAQPYPSVLAKNHSPPPSSASAVTGLAVSSKGVFNTSLPRCCPCILVTSKTWGRVRADSGPQHTSACWMRANSATRNLQALAPAILTPDRCLMLLAGGHTRCSCGNYL